jgi:hypothetical protein
VRSDADCSFSSFHLGKKKKKKKNRLPNVGKSTLFNVLTKMGVPAENFPFCTIDPSTSRVNVPDERFDFLVEKFKPKGLCHCLAIALWSDSVLQCVCQALI